MMPLVIISIVLIFGVPQLLDSLQGNQSFVFQGRVVDESGHGIPGVRIDVRVLRKDRLHVPSPWGPTGIARIDYSVMTNWSGEFSVRDKGTDMSLGGFAKPGYEIAWKRDPPAKWPPGRFSFDQTFGTPPIPTHIVIYPMRLLIDAEGVGKRGSR